MPLLTQMAVTYVAAATVAVATGSAHTVLDPEAPMLFMSNVDVTSTWGLLYPVAPAVVPIIGGDGQPTGFNFEGMGLLAAFDPSPLRPNDGYEVFLWNSTAVYFATSMDFRGLVGQPVPVAHVGVVPDSNPTNLSCYPKTIGRNDGGDRYAMLMFCEVPGIKSTEGLRALVAHDPTVPNAFSGPTKVAFHDHDDQVLLWDAPRDRWVNSQISFQNWTTKGYEPSNASAKTLKYCDNAGCLFRRVGGSRVSSDGISWSNNSVCNDIITGNGECFCSAPGGWNNSGILAPDSDLDPPELEFYKISMFWVGNRLAAHALLYAPSPMEELGDGYGMMKGNISCGGPAGLSHCHGPHMYIERMIGPMNGDPTAMAEWQRPFRNIRVSPRDELLNIGPVRFEGQLAWLSGSDTASASKTVQLFALPQYRVAGLYAPANAEFSTVSFLWPGDSALWLNFDAHWEGKGPGGSCDQKCQAYVMVAVQEANTGVDIPGYERSKCVFYDVNNTTQALAWKGDPVPIPAGHPVTLRFSFRDATIYALGVL